MQATRSLCGASRLPLTPKRGNKDFYKGTGQSYAPGGGHRTGPPGKHVVGGKAKYRLLDEKVRYFVGPGVEALNGSKLRPYVSTHVPVIPQTDGLEKPKRVRNLLPSFSPNALPPLATASTPADEELFLYHKDFTDFSKRYQRLPTLDKKALIMNTRKQFWEGMIKQYGRRGSDAEEAKTQEVEGRAEGAVSS